MTPFLWFCQLAVSYQFVLIILCFSQTNVVFQLFKETYYEANSIGLCTLLWLILVLYLSHIIVLYLFQGNLVFWLFSETLVGAVAVGLPGRNTVGRWGLEVRLPPTIVLKYFQFLDFLVL